MGNFCSLGGTQVVQDPYMPFVPKVAAKINSKLSLTVRKGNMEGNEVLFDAVGMIYPGREEGSGITYFITKMNKDNTTTEEFVPYFKREEYKIKEIHFAIRHDGEKDKYNIIHYNDIEQGQGPKYPIKVGYKITEPTVK